MALFGKLFEKKECAICGGEIGLLGNRKLADGNLCKNCAEKLSPFMTDRRESTVEEIRQHLAYREQNAIVLQGIHPTRLFGHGTKVYVDENAGKFFVTSRSNWQVENPDVIDINQVIECRVDVRENREQLYHKDPQGKNVPYNPPRYRSLYAFWVELHIDSPYFNEIRFELSDVRPDDPYGEAYRAFEQEAYELQYTLDPASYQAAQAAAQQTQAAAMANFAASNAAASVNRGADVANKVKSKSATGAAGAGSWTCQCGTVNEGNFCANCGAKRPVVFRCDKCGWMPTDPNNLPKFCPQCGDPFNEADAQ